MSLSIKDLELDKRYILSKGGNVGVFKDEVENGMECKLFKPHSKNLIRKGIKDKPMCTIHVISDEPMEGGMLEGYAKTYFQKLHQDWIDRGLVEIVKK